RHGDAVGLGLAPVEDRRAAVGAERERAPLAVVRDADVVGVAAFDLHALCREPGLRSEHTAGAPLTGEAGADRDADPVGLDGEPELPAAARGLPRHCVARST